MLSHLHLAIIIAVVVLLLLVLYIYMNPTIITRLEADYYNYPVYTLTANYTSGKTYAIANDLSVKRTFTTNQTGDGIFYETSPAANTSYSLAILVVKCSATDYSAAFTKVNSTVPASITSSVTPYVGVVVQYTPSTSGTMSKYLLNTDISASSVNALNWMGVVDLTLLFANAAGSTSFNINAIGVYSGVLPTINKVASSNSAFATATSVASWPPAVSGVTLLSVTAGAGFGINLNCTATSVNVSS